MGAGCSRCLRRQSKKTYPHPDSLPTTVLTSEKRSALISPSAKTNKMAARSATSSTVSVASVTQVMVESRQSDFASSSSSAVARDAGTDAPNDHKRRRRAESDGAGDGNDKSTDKNGAEKKRQTDHHATSGNAGGNAGDREHVAGENGGATKRSKLEPSSATEGNSKQNGSTHNANNADSVVTVSDAKICSVEEAQQTHDEEVTVSDIESKVFELTASQFRRAPNKSLRLRKEVFEKYKESVAGVLHDAWREPRLLPDGTYNPRPKEVNGKIYDIANLSFPQLPPKFQYENIEAADVACCFVVQSVWENHRWDPFELEVGADQVHESWMARNGAWAPPHQMVPYHELSGEEKDKDRVIVITAVQHLGKHFNPTIWADQSSRGPPVVDLTKLRPETSATASTTPGLSASSTKSTSP